MNRESVTAEEMAALEDNAEYLGVSKPQMMECAGKAVAEAVAALKKGKTCMFYLGTGRNGGDGMVAARHLASRGFQVSAVLVGGEEKISDPSVALNWKAVKNMDLSLRLSTARDSSLVPKAEAAAAVVVDALLGTGVRGRIQQPILQAVRAINQASAYRVAVDVPTGIDASTGEVLGEAVRADMTVTFHAPKTGLLKASAYAGKVVVADIGLPPEAEAYAGPGDVRRTRRTRPADAHKGDFGRLLVVGGSGTYTGAPALAGMAALQTGVDLVYVAAPRETARVVSSYSPNLITVKLSGDYLDPEDLKTLESYLHRATAVVLGPGLETRERTKEAVELLLKAVEGLAKPLLLDADGLKLFGALRREARTACVLTPHGGEFELVTGAKPHSGLRERGEQVKEASTRLKAVVLLKGNVDIISDGRRVKFNRTGNPGMTVGGTGDVLSGIVGGLMALGVKPFEASVAGAFVNGEAGNLTLKRKGYHILPTDLLEEVPRLMENPMLLREKP
ncbi:NAD(P)H-hydrate dehydratase [Candidatus Hecatella orcuttiae]|uniref:NAD(P)H-hydrate dehydratase n=1 Tax=Candidatus Hecatella orcuttiae TaxID=1935119 RepID=UPI0028682C04|nr:NAD(P)H-hydrate dehydratase [Candidatus Hecatella orcuttiae]